MALMLVLLSALMIIGALLWVKPSPRDRRLAKLRMQAIAQGLSLRSLRIDDLSIEGRVHQRSLWVTAYGCRFQSPLCQPVYWQLQRSSGTASAHLPKGWVWIEKPSPDQQAIAQQLAHWLRDMPDAIGGIALTSHDCSWVWDEHSSDFLDQLTTLTHKLESILNQS